MNAEARLGGLHSELSTFDVIFFMLSYPIISIFQSYLNHFNHKPVRMESFDMVYFSGTWGAFPICQIQIFSNVVKRDKRLNGS